MELICSPLGCPSGVTMPLARTSRYAFHGGYPRALTQDHGEERAPTKHAPRRGYSPASQDVPLDGTGRGRNADTSNHRRSGSFRCHGRINVFNSVYHLYSPSRIFFRPPICVEAAARRYASRLPAGSFGLGCLCPGFLTLLDSAIIFLACQVKPQQKIKKP